MLKKNQKGFTIIELLVVIVIIGILVALALPNLFAAQARGRDSERKNDLKNLQQKLETYFNDNGSYPTGDMAAVRSEITDITDDDATGPRNDAYDYESTDGSEYTLTADLENDNDPDATDGNYVINSVN